MAEAHTAGEAYKRAHTRSLSLSHAQNARAHTPVRALSVSETSVPAPFSSSASCLTHCCPLVGMPQRKRSFTFGAYGG